MRMILREGGKDLRRSTSSHVLALIDDEGMRRGIKGIRNLQEGRHDLARKVFHGR